MPSVPNNILPPAVTAPLTLTEEDVSAPLVVKNPTAAPDVAVNLPAVDRASDVTKPETSAAPSMVVVFPEEAITMDVAEGPI